MSFNTFGHLFRVTTWGESHGPALGAVVDGCPPGVRFAQEDLQVFMDKRKPGQSRFVTQRREDDIVKVLSGVMPQEDGTMITTGTMMRQLMSATAMGSWSSPPSTRATRSTPAAHASIPTSHCHHRAHMPTAMRA